MKTNRFLLFITIFFLAISCKEKPSDVSSQALDSVIIQKDTKANQIDSSLMIFPTTFRGIKLDGSLADAQQKFGKLLKKEILQTGEGDFDIFRLYDSKGNPLAFLMASENKPPMIDNITVTSELAQTAEGIKVGKNLGDLLKIYPKLTVSGSEIEGWTHAEADGFLFKLDTNFWEGNIDIKRLNKNTKITEVLLNGYQVIKEQEEN